MTGPDKLYSTNWETEIIYRGRPLSDYANAIREECARVAEDRRWGIHTPLEEIAAAIRALKDKPNGPR